MRTRRSTLSQFRAERGVALIIVLAMLLLLSGIIVAFMNSATTERAASSANAGVTNAREIADSTVSFVISQMREATTTPDDNTTWASQPGAIRTFAGKLGGGTQTGTLRDGAYWDDYSPAGSDSVYKLYSSPRMKVSAADYTNTDLQTETDVINNWNALDPAGDLAKYPDYVDLNTPILSTRLDLDSAGLVVEPRYPIIDPRAKLSNTDTDPSANPGIVDGFDAKFTSDPKLSFVKLDGMTKSTAKVPYLPMPVQWLYVLRDGSIGPASAATANNPIVGRTAFWTDDETCKLNINTSSEGTFWDTPSASSAQECGAFGKAVLANVDRGLNLAASQPIKGEFQRYPGHPFTTSLSPVLGWLWNLNFSTSPTPVNPYTNSGVNTAYNTYKEAIYQITPFTPNNTKTSATSLDATQNSDATADPLGSLSIKTKHLYTSVDELIFKSDRFTTSANTPPDVNSPLTPEALERVRFFLTATSRAPELNLFSRPRVTIWPVNAAAKYRTAFDDAFIFTSTLSSTTGASTKRYCFLRGDAKSAFNDLKGTFPAPAAADPRNPQLFTYLQNLTAKDIPGFGGNFSSKWSVPERDEVLTLIFDYIRSVDLADTGTTTRKTTAGTTNVFAPYTPRFFYAAPPPDQYVRYDRSYDWSGQVTPTRLTPTSTIGGMGRFITPTEVAMVFYTTTAPNPLPAGIPAGTKWVQAALLIEMSTSMPGYPGIRDTYWTKIRPARDNTGAYSLTQVQFANAAKPVNINLCYDKPENNGFFEANNRQNGIINVVNVSNHEVSEGRSFMATLGFSNSFWYFQEHKGPTLLAANALENPSADPNRVGGVTNPKPKTFDNSRLSNREYHRQNNTIPADPLGTVGYYPYVSDKIPVLADAGKSAPTSFSILAGSYDIYIYAGEAPDDARSYLDPAAQTPLQIVHITFPIKPTSPIALPTSGDFSTRFGGDTLESPASYIAGGDVVRSMELTCGQQDGTTLLSAPSTGPSSGDLRMAAVRAELPSNFYAPRGGLASYLSNVTQLHGLTRGHGDPEPNYYNPSGLLAASAGLRGDKPPILPAGLKGVFRSDGGVGDWDRGLSKHSDGAFGNKVDEGNIKWDYTKSDYTGMPYYRGRGIEDTGQTFFTPNRQLPSAVMFGSIPTGAYRNLPWQTLLFRPNRETKKHPGAISPPDHLMLDLFHMPVVEPYAISEPFSTAGKVNMNYVIAPFGYAKGANGTNPDTKNNRTYLRRDTALRGVLRSTFMMAVPTGQGDGGHTENPQSQGTPFRFPIDANRTLEEFETRLQYKGGQYPLFRSASEICTIDLYPKSMPNASAPSVSGWEAFWNTTYAITGDNMRERPYAHIYPRLTTKSNVYTVHMRCQTIRKSPNSAVGAFDPKLDTIVGEYRGSATIERFVDPNDPALANYDENSQKVDAYYRYRVVNTKHFAPR